MSNPFKPTARVLFLLGRIERGMYRGTVYLNPLRRFYRDNGATYQSGIRTASEREIQHMLTFDLIEEISTPGNHDTYDTSDPKRPVLIGCGRKLVLRDLGRRLLAEADTKRRQ